MILVTGITGGLAKDFSEGLLTQCVGIGRSKTFDKCSHYIHADISKEKDIQTIVKYIQDNHISLSSIVHIASCTDLNMPDNEMLYLNKMMTKNVLTLAKLLNIPKIIFISSPSIYAMTQDRKNIKEADVPAHQMSAYSKSKVESEKMILGSDVDSVICLRPKAILGPYDRLIAPKFMKLAKMPIIALPRKGHVDINTTDSRDVVSAIECALASSIKRGVYNIAGEVIEIKTLIQHVLSIFNMGHRRLISIPNLSFLGKPFQILQITCGAHQTLDISKAKTELLWKPQYSALDSIKRYKELNS